MLPIEIYDKIAFSLKYEKARNLSYWISFKTSKICEKNKIYIKRYKILRKIHMKHVFKETGYYADEKLVFLLENTGIRYNLQEIWIISRWYHHSLMENWVFHYNHRYKDFKRFIVETCQRNRDKAINLRPMLRKEGIKLLYYIQDYCYFMHSNTVLSLINKEYLDGRINSQKLKKIISKIPYKKAINLKISYIIPIQAQIKYLELREAIIKLQNK